MFKDYLGGNTLNIPGQSLSGGSSISLYPISEYNLEGIRLLYGNSVRIGSENINVQTASIDPSLWMGDFLDRHWSKIAYACVSPKFTITKIEGSKIVEKLYNTDLRKFDTEKELDKFFEKGAWKRFVLFSIAKYADLSTMKIYFVVRYADITEKFEERDNKINNILNDSDGTSNN